MSILRTFRNTLRVLWQLHTNTSVYRFIVESSRKTIITLLLTYYALFAVASSLLWLTLNGPQLSEKGFSAWKELQNAWPQDLEARYIDGTLSLLPQQKFELPYPAVLTRPEGFPSLLGTVDTSVSEAPGESTSLFFLSSRSLTAYQDGETTSTPLSEMLPTQDWTVNKQTLQENDGLVRRVLNSFVQLATPFIFLTAFGLVPLVRMLLLVPFAWLSLSLLGLTGNRMNYGRAYRLGLSLLPAAETTQLLLTALYPTLQLHVFWWIWLALLVLISVMNRKQLS